MYTQPTVTTILGLALLIINSFVALVLVVLMILKMGNFFLSYLVFEALIALNRLG